MKPSQIVEIRQRIQADRKRNEAETVALGKAVFADSTTYLRYARMHDPDAYVEHAAKFDLDDESSTRR
jgi:hypothetical protein